MSYENLDQKEEFRKIPRNWCGILLEQYDGRLDRVIIGSAVINNSKERAKRDDVSKPSATITMIIEGHVYRISFYENEDIKSIIHRSLDDGEHEDILNFDLEGRLMDLDIDMDYSSVFE